jgi:hypothetical protein
MGSVRGWPRAGGVRFSPDGGRRVASGSPCRYPRNTGAPDGFGGLAASPSARARRRHSPLPHPWPAPPVRASGHDLDGQLNGPAADGTDRSQVSVVRGGPQSFTAAPAGDLASGDPATAAGVGPGHQGTSRGLRRQLRGASGASTLVARHRTWCGVSRAPTPPGAASRSGSAHPRLSAGHFSCAAAELPVYPILLPVRTRGGHPARRTQGHLAGRSPSRPLSSVSSGRVRPCPLTL